MSGGEGSFLRRWFLSLVKPVGDDKGVALAALIGPLSALVARTPLGCKGRCEIYLISARTTPHAPSAAWVDPGSASAPQHGVLHPRQTLPKRDAKRKNHKFKFLLAIYRTVRYGSVNNDHLTIGELCWLKQCVSAMKN